MRLTFIIYFSYNITVVIRHFSSVAIAPCSDFALSNFFFRFLADNTQANYNAPIFRNELRQFLAYFNILLCFESPINHACTITNVLRNLLSYDRKHVLTLTIRLWFPSFWPARNSENIGPFSAQIRAHVLSLPPHPIKLRPRLGLHLLPFFTFQHRILGDLRHERARGKHNYGYRDIFERGGRKDRREGTFCIILEIYLAYLC